MAKLQKLTGICVITTDAGPGRGHLDIAKAAVAAGARMVQLREKDASTRELFELAKAIREITVGTQTLFIVNDRLDIALASDADGAHVGTDDLPWGEARQLLGPDRILGVSAATEAEAREADAAAADYLGVGPVYVTGSKADAGDAIGLEGIRRIIRATETPVCAIGGITTENAAPVWAAGASCLAVISAISSAPDLTEAIRQLQETMP
jgi:thiamine-phosphate pyrophosphorylase